VPKGLVADGDGTSWPASISMGSMGRRSGKARRGNDQPGVVKTVVRWGEQGGYFADTASRDAFRDELTHLLVRAEDELQFAGVFNVGVQAKPQCSACFINSVHDDMESIMGLTRTEGMLFKWGSERGTNFSALRGARKRFPAGIASGPVSFMKGFDAFAGVIKAGGRRGERRRW